MRKLIDIFIFFLRLSSEKYYLPFADFDQIKYKTEGYEAIKSY